MAHKNKPWIARRPGESLSQQIDRLNRTCFWCGKFFPQVSQCNTHEDKCDKQRN